MENIYIRMVVNGIRINFYCDEKGIPELDKEALKFLDCQVLGNPDASLDELFDDEKLTEEEKNRLSAVGDLACSLEAEVVIDAANKMVQDKEYRQKIYEQYQKEIVPLLEK